MPRLCKALEAVARGLYFHTKNKRFKGKVQVLPVFVKYRPGATMDLCQLLAEVHTDQERKNWPEFGENPKIFSCQIGTPDQYGLTSMVMTFYSKAEVLAAFQPKGVHLPFPKLSKATPEKPIDVEITIGKGEDTQKLIWKCDGKKRSQISRIEPSDDGAILAVFPLFLNRIEISGTSVQSSHRLNSDSS